MTTLERTSCQQRARSLVEAEDSEDIRVSTLSHMPLGMVRGQPATQNMNTGTLKMSPNTLYEQSVNLYGS